MDRLLGMTLKVCKAQGAGLFGGRGGLLAEPVAVGCQARAHFGAWELKDGRGPRWLDRSPHNERALEVPGRWSEGSWGGCGWDTCNRESGVLPLKHFRSPGPQTRAGQPSLRPRQ